MPKVTTKVSKKSEEIIAEEKILQRYVKAITIYAAYMKQDAYNNSNYAYTKTISEIRKTRSNNVYHMASIITYFTYNNYQHGDRHYISRFCMLGQAVSAIRNKCKHISKYSLQARSDERGRVTKEEYDWALDVIHDELGVPRRSGKFEVIVERTYKCETKIIIENARDAEDANAKAKLIINDTDWSKMDKRFISENARSAQLESYKVTD